MKYKIIVWTVALISLGLYVTKDINIQVADARAIDVSQIFILRQSETNGLFTCTDSMRLVDNQKVLAGIKAYPEEKCQTVTK
jgi:hypothetical protein